MKSYDSYSIKARLLSRLSQKDSWKNIIEDSALDSLITVLSEAESEDVRYSENLFREKTWNQLQNLSSATEQAGFFGYSPHRKVSSIGYLHFAYEDLTAITVGELENLSNTHDEVTIPALTVIPYSIPLLVTEDVTFVKDGKYVEVPVIQGTRIDSLTMVGQELLGIPFQEIKIPRSDIEAALDTVSGNYFSVQLQLTDNTIINCEKVDSIYLADSDTYAYEVINVFNDNDPDSDYFILKFGNNVTGKIPPSGSIVIFDGLSTLGLNGNITDIGVVNGSIIIENTTYYYKNYSKIIGGSDRDDIESIRGKAPKQYLLEGSIISKLQYKQAIESIPYVYKAIVYSGTYLGRDSVLFSAIDTYGDAPDETNIEADLLSRISDRKSSLDLIKFVTPDFIDIQYNYKAELKPDQSRVDYQTTLYTSIKTLLNNNYGILNTEFKESISNIDVSSYITNMYKEIITPTLSFILAKQYLQTSTFIYDSQQFLFRKSFQFNPAFINILRYECVPFYMRIDVVFACESLSTKNRSFFLTKNSEYIDETETPGISPFIITQFTFIDFIVDDSNIDGLLAGTVNGYPVILDGSLDYVDMIISIDWGSSLFDSTITFPDTYILPNQAPEMLDDCIQIHAYSYPKNFYQGTILPTEENSLIRLAEEAILVEIT